MNVHVLVNVLDNAGPFGRVVRMAISRVSKTFLVEIVKNVVVC